MLDVGRFHKKKGFICSEAGGSSLVSNLELFFRTWCREEMTFTDLWQVKGRN